MNRNGKRKTETERELTSNLREGQNTGYKQFDPSHPCRKCWERYGKSWSSPLAYATNLENQSQILQRPLPASGSNFIPPTMSSHGSYSGHHAGNYQVPPNWQSPYQAPSGPPPPPPARPGPPRVNRASTADEAVDDPSGEAPPAYDDAINNEHPLPPQQTGTSSTSSAQTTASSPPIPARPSQTQVQPPSHPPYRPPPEEPQQWYGQGLGQGQHHFGAPPVMHRPLVVQPGDPRIGGQLCYKCGGQGMRSR